MSNTATNSMLFLAIDGLQRAAQDGQMDHDDVVACLDEWGTRTPTGRWAFAGVPWRVELVGPLPWRTFEV